MEQGGIKNNLPLLTEINNNKTEMTDKNNVSGLFALNCE